MCTISLKKGPFVDEKLYRKVERLEESRHARPIKTWARSCTIVPEFVGHTFQVHNGRVFNDVFVTEDMVGHKLGRVRASTRTLPRAHEQEGRHQDPLIRRERLTHEDSEARGYQETCRGGRRRARPARRSRGPRRPERQGRTRRRRELDLGRDHPRCKRRDIDALATALGCLPKDIAKYTSMVRRRGSPKKAKLVTDMIKGKSFEDASQMLEFSTKRAASNVRKALMAAQADAEQLGADTNELVVSEARVDRGMHIKRFRPKDRGRAHPITKHTSHITVSLQERS